MFECDRSSHVGDVIVVQKPMGNSAVHLGFATLSIFLTNLASTAVFEIMQGTGVRLLNFKDDVIVSGVNAAVWRLDAMTDMEVVYIILSKVCPS